MQKLPLFFLSILTTLTLSAEEHRWASGCAMRVTEWTSEKSVSCGCSNPSNKTPPAPSPIEYTPFYTGTFLDPVAVTVAPGDVYLQPVVAIVNNYALYDNGGHVVKSASTFVVAPNIVIETGITKWLSATLIAQGFYRKSGDADAITTGPLLLGLNLQCLRDEGVGSHPSLRLSVLETFPIGHYNNLDSKKKGVNAPGNGAFATTLLGVLKKIFYTYPHPFALELSSAYSWNQPVDIHGYTYYGGSSSTHGTARPGNQFLIDLGIEVSLTQHWVIASDLNYQYQCATHFSGNTGGPDIAISQPHNQIFSVTPSIEYNWTSSLGIIFGAWFSLAGQNNSAFAGGFFELAATI